MDGSPETKSDAVEIVRGATLTEQVYRELRRKLLFGELKPGSKITARSVGRSMGVSLTPARDAIGRLVREGAIEKSETHMYSIPLLDRGRYAEICTIRMLLEPMAAELAVSVIDDADVDAIDALNEAMRAELAAEAFDAALRLDTELHFTLYDIAASSDLRRIIDGLWLLVGPMRTRLPLEYRVKLSGYSIHRELIEALRARDAKGANAAIHKDIKHGSEALLSELS